MKKVWKGAAAAIAALSLGATGFIGATSAYAVVGGVPENGSITITNATANDTFTAYMPFLIHSVSADGTYAYKINTGAHFSVENLAAIIHGIDNDFATNGATEEKILNWLTSHVGTGDDKTSGADFAKAMINGIKDYNKDAADTAKITAAFTDQALNSAKSNLTPGYYVIEQTNSPAAGTGNTSTVSKYLAGNVEKDSPLSKTLKNESVTSEKKIKENDKNTTGTNDGRIPGLTWNESDKWNDVADYNIGDDIDFMLAGTLPENYGDYTYYKYEFNDTLSTGLTLKTDSFVVKVDNGTNNKTTLTAYTQYVMSPTDNGFVLKVGTAVDGKDYRDLKGIQAVTKDSKIIVTYKATLNNNAVIGFDGNTNEMNLSFSNNPNQGHEGDTGTTPTDKVIAFTYQLDIEKYNASDASKPSLAGAEFKLWESNKGTSGNRAAKLTQVMENGQPKAGYYKFAGWTTTAAEQGTLQGDANGKFYIAGLDDGTYYLEETKAPAGFNILEDFIKITIKATTVNDQAWTGADASDALTGLGINVNDEMGQDNKPIFTPGNTNNGNVVAQVGNNKGSNLPETGGMGTTMLYVAGGAIVLIAGIGMAVALRRRQA